MSILNINNYNDLLKFLDEVSENIADDRISTLIEELYSPKIINHIRIMVMRAVGLESLKTVLDKFAVIIPQLKLKLPEHLDLVYLGNLSYLSPNYFWNNIPYFQQAFSQYDSRASSLFLCRDDNFKRIVELLKENDGLVLSAIFLLNIAFKVSIASQSEKNDLIFLLSKCSSKDRYYNLVRTAIMKRLNSLAEYRESVKNVTGSDQKRKALFISGQIRNIHLMLPKLKEYYDISKWDIYISSWKNEGRTVIDRARLSRRVEIDALEAINKKFTDKELDRISKFETEQYLDDNNSLENLLSNTLNEAGELHINLLNDHDVVYRMMDNHHKMYFHNAYWVKKFGHDYFLNKYDYILKTRPDLLLSCKNKVDLDITLLEKGNVQCDHPSWLYEPWGFGMGDQLFGGRTENMLPLLDITYPESLSTRILSELFGSLRMYQGHINLGIELWLQGGKPIAIDIKKLGLAADKKLTEQQFFQLAEKAGLHV